MRKRLISSTPEKTRPNDEGWINVDGAAVVDVTSEEEGYPIESALHSKETPGWRAAAPGSQTIRLVFDPAAKAQARRPCFRGKQYKTHPRIRIAMVS